MRTNMRFAGSGVGRGAAVVLLLGLLAPGAGCGSGRRAVHPVRGQVFAGKDKKPATGAMVMFHPVRPDDGPVYKPNGYVDGQGRFTLTTYEEGDGAPAGEYVVTLEWLPPRKSAFAPEGSDRLKGAYRDPKTSNLRFAVQAGVTNEVPAILLP